jgi:hypothetical protein
LREMRMLRLITFIDTMEMVCLDRRELPWSSAHFGDEASGHCAGRRPWLCTSLVHSIELLYLAWRYHQALVA